MPDTTDPETSATPALRTGAGRILIGMLLLFVSFVWLGVVLLTSSTSRGYVSGSGGEATVDYYVNGTSYSAPISSFSTYSESGKEVRVFYDTKDPSGGSSSGVEYWMPPTFFFVLGAFFLFVGA